MCLTRKTTKHPAPSPQFFYTRDFDTCFARQRRALRHLSFQSGPKLVSLCIWTWKILETCFAPVNFQKWSGRDWFCTFEISNAFCATVACTFCHVTFQKWAETIGFFHTTPCNCSSLISLDGSAPATLASLCEPILASKPPPNNPDQ